MTKFGVKWREKGWRIVKNQQTNQLTNHSTSNIQNYELSSKSVDMRLKNPLLGDSFLFSFYPYSKKKKKKKDKKKERKKERKKSMPYMLIF